MTLSTVSVQTFALTDPSWCDLIRDNSFYQEGFQGTIQDCVILYNIFCVVSGFWIPVLTLVVRRTFYLTWTCTNETYDGKFVWVDEWVSFRVCMQINPSCHMNQKYVGNQKENNAKGARAFMIDSLITVGRRVIRDKQRKVYARRRVIVCRGEDRTRYILATVVHVSA